MKYTKALNNPIFEIISKASQDLGLESYVIGGFVRDFLLQRDFKKDIDVVAVGSHFAGFVAAVVGFVDSDADYAVDLT